jgi:hypothetical protein
MTIPSAPARRARSLKVRRSPWTVKRGLPFGLELTRFGRRFDYAARRSTECSSSNSIGLQ